MNIDDGKSQLSRRNENIFRQEQTNKEFDRSQVSSRTSKVMSRNSKRETQSRKSHSRKSGSRKHSTVVNSENEETGDENDSGRQTPLSQRVPTIIYHDEVKPSDLNQKIKIDDGEDETIEQKEFHNQKKAVLKKILRTNFFSADRYSLVPEKKSNNPFMTKLMKSSEFQPEQGVTHYDRANDQNSPNVSGGKWRHPNKDIISRQEFKLRKSLATLKDMGPQTERGYISEVGQSPELRQFSLTNSRDDHRAYTNVPSSMVQSRKK